MRLFQTIDKLGGGVLSVMFWISGYTCASLTYMHIYVCHVQNIQCNHQRTEVENVHVTYHMFEDSAMMSGPSVKARPFTAIAQRRP